MRTHRFLAALGGVIAVAGLSACSLRAAQPEPVFQTPAPEASATPTPDSGEAAGAEAPPAGGAPQLLRIATIGGFSPIVVNGKGRTIYRFDRDSNDPPTTTCVDECNETWQPVLAPNGVEVDAGIEEDLVGTVTRPDGNEQLTLNGWPMYYHHKDLKLGQTVGHGTSKAWFAISPMGGRAQKDAEAAPATKPQVLRVAEVDGLSPAVVVNAKGRTVYRFEKDDNNPPRTACAGDCLKTWQPVLAPNGVQVDDGIDNQLVGVITRPDGSKQLTLKGWPLYYFHKDLKLGQIAGHGVKGQWFAITAGGGKAKKSAASDGTNSESGSGSY
jgi:predicted lipoprotein with Yx(FWY)xxD motif